MTEKTPNNTAAPRLSEFQEILVAFGAIVLSLFVTAQFIPSGIQEYAYSIILASMVWLPVLRIEKRGYKLSDYGIHLKGFWKEIGFALIWMAVIFPPFIVGNHFWKLWITGHHYFSFALPEKNLLYIFFEQAVLIALPEEFFYRSWVLTVFSKRWPKAMQVLGGDFGKAVFLTSALFAIGHLATIPLPFRLGVFFPSLLFCWMRMKRGSIISPIILHGLSNLLMAVLNASYR